MKTSSVLFLILIALTLGSCKSFDHAMIKAENDPISPKLLTLERRMGDFANTTVVTDENELRLVTQEVEQNLIDPYGDKYGYIVYKRTVIEQGFGMGYSFVSGLLLMTPTVFGFPVSRPRLTIEVEIRILDRSNRLIGKYTAIGEGEAIAALYYGYGLGAAGRKAYTEAYTDAFSKIRPQIQADVERLNQELREAGKL